MDEQESNWLGSLSYLKVHHDFTTPNPWKVLTEETEEENEHDDVPPAIGPLRSGGVDAWSEGVRLATAPLKGGSAGSLPKSSGKQFGFEVGENSGNILGSNTRTR